MAEAHGPAGPRRRLGAELRRLRNKSGLHLEDVAREMSCSTSKISRLENGKGIPKPPDVRELMRIYGVTSDTERDMLLRLVRDGRQQGWWEPYTEGVQSERFVLDAPGRYAALETEATGVVAVSVTVLHGLVQERRYSTQVMRALLPHHSDSEIDRLVELRMQRQERLFDREAPLALSLVVDEALLNRVVGGPEIMAAQLDRMIEVAQLSNVDIRVLGFEAGFHRALSGQFVVLKLRGGLDDVVYVEGHAGDTYLDSESDVKLFEDIHSDVLARCMPPDESLTTLERYRSGQLNSGRPGG